MGFEAYNLSGGMGAKDGSGWLGAGYAVVKYTTQQFLNEKVDRYFANLPENKNQVSAADFLNAVAEGEDAVVLDIRSAEDYAAGHVKGAINVPYGIMLQKRWRKFQMTAPSMYTATVDRPLLRQYSCCIWLENRQSM